MDDITQHPVAAKRAAMPTKCAASCHLFVYLFVNAGLIALNCQGGGEGQAACAFRWGMGSSLDLSVFAFGGSCRSARRR
jgi:hypothetical protein